MSDSRDGSPLRDLINKEKISLKKERSCFQRRSQNIGGLHSTAASTTAKVFLSL